MIFDFMKVLTFDIIFFFFFFSTQYFFFEKMSFELKKSSFSVQKTKNLTMNTTKKKTKNLTMTSNNKDKQEDTKLKINIITLNNGMFFQHYTTTKDQMQALSKTMNDNTKDNYVRDQCYNTYITLKKQVLIGDTKLTYFFLIFSSKKKKQPNCFFCIFYDDILHHTPTKNSVPKCQPETSSKLHTQSKTDETKTEEKEWPVIDVFKEHNGPFKYYIIIRTGGQDITL